MHLFYYSINWAYILYTGWIQSRFTVVHMENTTIINNTTRMNCILCIHNYKPILAPPCILICKYNSIHNFKNVRKCGLKYKNIYFKKFWLQNGKFEFLSRGDWVNIIIHLYYGISCRN